jgi:hypothetical protein
VLFGLVTTRPRHAGDSAAESMLGIASLGTTVDHTGAASARHVVATDFKGVIIGRQGVTDLVVSRPKRLSVREVLIVEAIDLDV